MGHLLHPTGEFQLAACQPGWSTQMCASNMTSVFMWKCEIRSSPEMGLDMMDAAAAEHAPFLVLIHSPPHYHVPPNPPSLSPPPVCTILPVVAGIPSLLPTLTAPTGGQLRQGTSLSVEVKFGSKG